MVMTMTEQVSSKTSKKTNGMNHVVVTDMMNSNQPTSFIGGLSTSLQNQSVIPNLIFRKMNAVMKDIKSVSKDQTNSAQGFKFRGIDQFVNALYPALTRHGVFM